MVSVPQLQAEMADAMAAGDLVVEAADRARTYLRAAAQRRVAPDAAAVAGLERFREPLPEAVGDPQAILRLLDEVGSPGTVAQVGGRFFGLVNGGAVPVGLAARVLADAWDQNAALYAVSPTTAVLEETWELDFALQVEGIGRFRGNLHYNRGRL